MGLQVYINGSWSSKEEAKISVWDHGFLYGDGIFEGIRVYHGKIFKLEEHLNRLYSSAKYILLNIPMTQEEMTKAVIETVRRNGLEDAYIRLIVSRGTGDLGVDPRKCKTASVVIIVDKIALYPQETYQRGLRVMTSSTRRNAQDSLNGRIKSLNYMNNTLAKLEHIHYGLDESLMLNHNGYLVEGAGENIFLVKGSKLLTPPCHLGALEGVTRGVVMKLAPTLGLSVEETLINAYDLYVADECFLTGTGAEIISVVEADGRLIGTGKPGPVTTKILNAFRALTKIEGTPVFVKDETVKAQAN